MGGRALGRGAAGDNHFRYRWSIVDPEGAETFIGEDAWQFIGVTPLHGLLERRWLYGECFSHLTTSVWVLLCLCHFPFVHFGVEMVAISGKLRILRTHQIFPI